MSVHDWASLATILLCLEAFVMSLVALAASYFLGRGATYVLREARRLFALAREYQIRIQAGADRVTHSIVAPFFAVERFFAAIRGVLLGIRKLVALK